MSLVINMKEHIEIEYKVLLDQKTFQTLLNHYPHYHEYIQTNYYFTHPLLKQKKYMLRIREKNNNYEMTLKRPLDRHHLESNIKLSEKEKDAFFNQHYLDNEVINILRKEGIDPSTLQQQFSLTTHRYDIELKEGMLSLDENTYLQQIDYELEFEIHAQREAYAKFLDIIKPFGIEYTSNCPSKIQRVYMQLEKLKL